MDTASVTITNKSDSNKINTYDKCQIKISVEPKNASCSSFDYSSSDNNIATVSKEGMVDLKKEGIITNYPYTIVGNTLNLIANNNYEITNGNSATVRVNFDYEKNNLF